MTCPLLYRFRVIDKLPEPPSPAAARGTLVHAVLERLFDQPAPYISGWHQAPARAGREHFALHLELFTLRRSNDKLKYLAGSESGMDAFANDILPEQAAARLRELG